MKVLGVILALAIIAAVAVFGITSATSSKQAAPPSAQQTENADATAEPKRGTKIGELAPEFELVKTDGSRVSLNDLQGKPAVVVFWSTYCSSCREEAPELNKLAATFEPQGVKVLGINVDSSDARLNEGIEDFKIKYETVRDIGTNVARSYRVTGTPTVIFLDKKGAVRYFGNELPADYAAQLEAINAQS